MGSESSLKAWVSDRLMSILGYSQPLVVQYMIGLAKDASSPADVMSKLLDYGFKTSSETRSFAEEIYEKVPRKASGINLYQKQEREAAMLVKKQQSYALLDADDEDEEDKPTLDHKKVDSKKKRFRKKPDITEEEDDEVVAQEQEKRQVKRRTSKYEDEDTGSESEEERIRDQREREQLEQSMRERDKAGTRKLADPKLSRKEQEEAARRSKALEEDDIQALRKVSRQEYLKKREQKKLEEIRDDIEDEQYLFDGVKLTEAENRELRYKKEIYELVKKRSEEADDLNEYRMPDAYDVEGGVNQEKRFSVAMQRYRDTGSGDKMNPFAEQEAWEQHQIEKATLRYGSKNRKQASDDYSFVFEDQIDFIKATVMEGDNFEESAEESEDFKKTAFKNLQEERKTLPVYSYREQLLQAGEEHQVLVIVGETGSGKMIQIPQYLHKAGYTKRGMVHAVFTCSNSLG